MEVKGGALARRRQNFPVTDARLIGRWSDDRLYLGAMETTDLIFMADGAGWSVWSNALGCEQILYSWSATDDQLVIATQRYVRLEGGGSRLAVVSDKDWDKTIETGFVIRAGHDVVGVAVTLLELDQRVSFGDRFALARRELQPEDDPAGLMLH